MHRAVAVQSWHENAFPAHRKNRTTTSPNSTGRRSDGRSHRQRHHTAACNRRTRGGEGEGEGGAECRGQHPVPHGTSFCGSVVSARECNKTHTGRERAMEYMMKRVYHMWTSTGGGHEPRRGRRAIGERGSGCTRTDSLHKNRHVFPKPGKCCCSQHTSIIGPPL